MMNRVKNVRKFRIMDDWNHVDFVYGKTAKNLLYVEILRIINAETDNLMKERISGDLSLKVNVSVNLDL